jgi:hypothetical protein
MSEATLEPQINPLPTDKHVELAAFIELLYVRNGIVPSAQDLRDQIPDCTVTDEQYTKFTTNKAIKEYLINERSIPLGAHARLTQKQLDWIRVVTDPSDQRPLARKLTELNLKIGTVRAWNNNRFYAQVLYEQTNKTFGNSRYAVLRSLQLEAMAGNISAIKLYLEMTGDYSQNPPDKNSKQASQPQAPITTVNVAANATNNTANVTIETRSLVNALLEILQRNLEPELLTKVVEELERATIPALPTVSGASPIDTAYLPTPPAAPRMEIEPLKKPKRPKVPVTQARNGSYSPLRLTSVIDVLSNETHDDDIDDDTDWNDDDNWGDD